MAINFEAANMAGYNNPKIEVFKATMDIATMKISDAPRKAELLRCLSRGSIPAIMLTALDGSESSLLWPYTWTTENVGDSIYFANPAYILMYRPDSESPIVSAGA